MAEDVNQIIAEADRKFEENDFVGAIQGYRAAASLMPPDEHVLWNLRSVEQAEQRMFLRELRQKYPESLVVRDQEAQLVRDTQSSSTAIRLCTEALALVKDNPRMELHFRFTRLRAAVQSNEFRLIYEDFLFLWQATSQTRHKKQLLSLLSSIHDIRFIRTLEKLAENPIFPAPIIQFFLAHIAQINTLENYWETLADYDPEY